MCKFFHKLIIILYLLHCFQGNIVQSLKNYDEFRPIVKKCQIIDGGHKIQKPLSLPKTNLRKAEATEVLVEDGFFDKLCKLCDLLPDVDEDEDDEEEEEEESPFVPVSPPLPLKVDDDNESDALEKEKALKKDQCVIEDEIDDGGDEGLMDLVAGKTVSFIDTFKDFFKYLSSKRCVVHKCPDIKRKEKLELEKKKKKKEEQRKKKRKEKEEQLKKIEQVKQKAREKKYLAAKKQRESERKKIKKDFQVKCKQKEKNRKIKQKERESSGCSGKSCCYLIRW